MKKKIFILSVFVLLIGVVVIYHNYDKNNILDDTESKVIKKDNTLSMMLETEAGSGKYEMTTRSDWPTDGYVFNSSLSRCENGGELAWDSVNKTIVMKTRVTDKCYVYFDVYAPTIVDYVKSLYTGTQGDNDIYYHDNSLTNGAGDNSYRYAGANPNNYVCFGSSASPCPTDNLYRIIGVFGNSVKLVKYDYATSSLLGTDGDYCGTATPDTSYYKGSLTSLDTYYWNYKNDITINDGKGSNTWSTSLLNKVNLNTNFVNNIGTEWANKIIMTTWKVGGNTAENILYGAPATTYQNEIINPDPTNSTDNLAEYNAKIGLMYVSDYEYAASPTYWTYPGADMKSINGDGSTDYRAARASNWSYSGANEWSISRFSDHTYHLFYFDKTGMAFVRQAAISFGYSVRPTFYLESSTIYKSGTGTQSDPIILS